MSLGHEVDEIEVLNPGDEWASDDERLDVAGLLPGSLDFYTYDGSRWSRLSRWIPVVMESLGGKLAVAFDNGTGTWLYGDAGGWSFLSSWQPEQLLNWGGQLAADFGPQGLWLHDGSWSQATSWDATALEAMSNRLAAVFANGSGTVWTFDGSSWASFRSAAERALHPTQRARPQTCRALIPD